MIWLKVDIDRRNARLEASVFKPVPDEILSTFMVNLLLTLGVVVTIVSPLLQTALAFAYVKFGHSWKRVWRINVLSSDPHPDVQNEDTNISDRILLDKTCCGFQVTLKRKQGKARGKGVFESEKIHQTEHHPFTPRQKSEEPQSGDEM